MCWLKRSKCKRVKLLWIFLIFRQFIKLECMRIQFSKGKANIFNNIQIRRYMVTLLMTMLFYFLLLLNVIFLFRSVNKFMLLVILFAIYFLRIWLFVFIDHIKLTYNHSYVVDICNNCALILNLVNLFKDKLKTNSLTKHSITNWLPIINTFIDNMDKTGFILGAGEEYLCIIKQILKCVEIVTILALSTWSGYCMRFTRSPL